MKQVLVKFIHYEVKTLEQLKTDPHLWIEWFKYISENPKEIENEIPANGDQEVHGGSGGR